MDKRITILSPLCLLVAACGGGGDAADEAPRERAIEVASRPFTIGNEVSDQMGVAAGEMGIDRTGDPALNALAPEPDTVPEAPAQDASDPRFTSEGGPEGS